MNALVLAMIVAVTTFRFFVSRGWLPNLFTYVPEVLSILAAVYVVVSGGQNRFQYVRPVYWLVFGTLLVGVICGAIVNDLDTGPMFAGLRTNLRALPFFLLPAVLLITEKQLRTQLAILVAVCFVQLPIAWYQRVIESGSRITFTGDYTFGTIMSSGMLSMFLVGAACVLTGFYLRKRIAALPFLLTLLWILLPTTLNETKITLFLVPIALLTTVYVASEHGTRARNMFLGIAICAAFLAIFIPVYDYLVHPRWGYGILDFITMEDRMEGYLLHGTEIGDQAKGGRIDGMIAAAVELAKDPAKLFFGFGIGNASDSSLGEQFNGAYVRLFEFFPLNSFSYILLEHGVLGIVLVLTLHWLIVRDALAVARRDQGIVGALAVGWVGVSVVMVIGLVYHTPITNLPLSYLFWLFSGLIVAHRQRLVLAMAPHVKRLP